MQKKPTDTQRRGRPRSHKKRINITMNPKLANEISREAFRLNIDRSTLISVLCTQWLKEGKNNQKAIV